MTEPREQPERTEGVREDVIYVCRGCRRVGDSARDLLAQGCEGHPEPFLPLSALSTTEPGRTWFVFFCDSANPSHPMEVGFEREEYDECSVCHEPLRPVLVTPVREPSLPAFTLADIDRVYRDLFSTESTPQHIGWNNALVAFKARLFRDAGEPWVVAYTKEQERG